MGAGTPQPVDTGVNRVPAEGTVTLEFPNLGSGAAGPTPAEKFLTRTSAQSDYQAGRAYLLAHPEEIPGAEDQLATQQAQQHEAATQAGQKVGDLETAIKVLDPVAKILTGVGAMGTNAGALTELGVPAVTSMLGAPLLTKLQDMGSDAAKALGQKIWGQGHPIADVLAQVAGGAAAGATTFGPLGAINAGEGENAVTAAAKEAAPDATDTEEAVEGQVPAAGGGVTGSGAAPSAGGGKQADSWVSPEPADSVAPGDTETPQIASIVGIRGSTPPGVPKQTMTFRDQTAAQMNWIRAGEQPGAKGAMMTSNKDGTFSVTIWGKPQETPGVTGYARGSVSNAPIPQPIALTPQDAVNSLAQKQAAALQSLRAGQTVAERIGRPDIATTVPESETMAAGEAQNLTPEQVAAEAENVPVATRMAALTSAMDAEAADLHKTALDIVTRAGNGENVDADLANLDQRYGAFATDSSPVQMTQGSELARGLEIMNPLKPKNLRIASTARVAQQLPEGYSPMMLAEMLAKQTDPEIMKSAAMADHISGKASVGQMLYSLYRFGMLADLKTPLRILLSNAATSLAEVPVRAVASVLPGSGDIATSEATSMLRGSVAGIKEGLRIWYKSATEGGPAYDRAAFAKLADTDYAKEGVSAGYLSGTSPLRSDGTGLEKTIWGQGIDHLGDYVEKGMGALVTGPHQFGKVIAHEAQAEALAYPIARDQAIAEGLTGAAASARIKQLMPLIKARPDIFAAANNWSDFATFTRQTEGAGIVNSLANSDNPFARSVGTTGKWLFPFRSISNQMIRYGAQWIPLPITRENWAGFTQVGREAGLARARMGLGTAIGMAVAYHCLAGDITGDGPQSKQARLMNEKQHISPNSVRVPTPDGAYYVGMPEPFRQPMSLIANAIEAAPYLEQAAKDGHPILDENGTAVTPELALYMAALGTARSFTDMPTMETASHIFDLVDGISSDKNFPAKFSQFTGQLAGGAIPFSTLARQAAKAWDPSLNEVNDWMDNIRNRIPALAKDGSPTRDWTGRPVVSQPGVLANMISPINVTKEKLDPADQVLQANGVIPPNVPYYIGGQPGLVPDPNTPAPVPLSPRAREQWAKLRGGYNEKTDTSATEQEILNTAKSPGFAKMNQAQRRIVLNHIQLVAARNATMQLLGWAQKNDPQLFAQAFQHAMAKKTGISPTDIPAPPDSPEPEEEAGAPTP